MDFFPTVQISPVKQGKTRVECAFVGASFATLLTAIQLADAGFSVQIFEEESELGLGDSGQTLLPASLSFTDNLFRLNASLGDDNCFELLKTMQRGLTYLQKHQLIHGETAVEISMHDTEWAELQKSKTIAEKLGFPMKIATQEYLEQLGGGFSSAIYYSQQGYVEPFTIYQHLYNEVKDRNIVIVPNTKIHSFDQNGGEIVLHHDRGHCTSDFLFLGAGLGNRQLDVFFSNKLTPVRTQMMAIPHQESHMSMMCETQYGYIQFRDTQMLDNRFRLLTGCRWATPHLEMGEESKGIVDRISQAQWRFANKHFSFCQKQQLQDIKKWSTIQTYSCDGLPIVGPLPGREHIFSLCAFRDRQASLGIGSALLLSESLLSSSQGSIPSILKARRFH